MAVTLHDSMTNAADEKITHQETGPYPQILRVLILVLLGVFIGILGFEAIMLVRVLRLRTHNPARLR